MKTLFQVTVLIMAILIMTYAADFVLYKHSQEHGSSCLDGTPSALYTYIGTQPTKVLIYFEGGGLCQGNSLSLTIQDCYQRSQTDLGSSAKYPETRNFDNYGLLSSSRDTNPQFYTWSKAFIPYCDGSLHQGSRHQPLQYKGKKLFFRGSNNTQTHFVYLNWKLKLLTAEKVILTGTSAGAIASLMWSNYLHDRLVKPQALYIVPDSGVMIFDHLNPFTQTRPVLDGTDGIYRLANDQTQMPLAQCVLARGNDKSCAFPGTIAQFIKPPVFIIQSQYDMWAIGTIFRFSCADYRQVPTSFQTCNDQQRVALQQYRFATLSGINNYTTYHQQQKVGVWSIACAQHGFIQDNSFMNSKNYLVPANNGLTIYQALKKFIDADGIGSHVYIDTLLWPQNQKCNGKKSKIMQRSESQFQKMIKKE